MSDPGPATRLFAVLGQPVSHSLSPVFQNAAIRAARLDAVYVALACAAADLPGLLRGLARAGGGGNVTLPHKARAADAVERRTAAVERTGACNTFWHEAGEVWGDNTDVEGVRDALAALGVAPRRVLLLGAGGAAAAVLAALEELRVDEVAVANRSLDRARALCERFRSSGLGLAAASRASECAGEWDLVVNATSLGLRPGELPPVEDARFAAALDLVYAPGGTAWVRALGARGVPAADGTEMLIRQGAAAFRRWFGAEPDIGIMRQALARGAAPRTS